MHVLTKIVNNQYLELWCSICSGFNKYINKNPPIARGKIKGETPSCPLNKYPSKLVVNTTAKKAAS